MMGNVKFWVLLKISNSLQRISILFNKAGKRINPKSQSPRQKAILAWQLDRGDKTLRLDYDLDDKSLVFDLGGYEGQWTSDIFSRYCCKVHIFEPVSAYSNQINKRFSKNNNIIVHNFGLANETATRSISLMEDGSSLFKTGTQLEQIQLKNATEFIVSNQITKIDLMKINIEGAEYDLLEHIVKTGVINRIVNIQVQFHDFVPQADERIENIYRKLRETHYLTYQYRFVWDNWKLK